MRNYTPAGLERALRGLRLVLMDVDGVLTDGKLYHLVGRGGRLVELKGVDTQDGLGLAWLARRGVATGVISGRRSDGLAARARMLGMRYVVQGTLVTEAETAFVGDDLTDLPLVRRAGVGVAVANARPELKRAARYVTRAPGGAGALREFSELVLKAKGLWDDLLRSYGA